MKGKVTEVEDWRGKSDARLARLRALERGLERAREADHRRVWLTMAAVLAQLPFLGSVTGMKLTIVAMATITFWVVTKLVDRRTADRDLERINREFPAAPKTGEG